MFLSDSAEETVLSGIALPEARRKTRMAQEESKIPDLTSLTEMVLEEAVQATKRHDVDGDGDGGKKNADADADDFLSRKTLTDVTNCPRRRSVLNQVKLATYMGSRLAIVNRSPGFNPSRGDCKEQERTQYWATPKTGLDSAILLLKTFFL